MEKSHNSFYLIIGLFLIYFTIAFLCYHALLNSYFQQDEWLGFGLFIRNPANATLLGIIKNSFQSDLNLQSRSLFTHYVPLTLLISFLQFYYFKLHFQFYALSSIVLHALNCVVLYAVTYLLFKKKHIAFFSSLLFASDSIHAQAITWISTYTPTLFAFFFGMGSVAVYLYFLRSKYIRYLLISYGLIFISLFFKESAFFLVIFYPFIAFFKKKKVFFMSVLLSTMVILLFFLFRIIAIFQHTTTLPVVQKTGAVTIFSSELVLRFIGVPVKMFTQAFIPENVTLTLSYLVSKPLFFFFPHLYKKFPLDIFTERYVSSFLLYFFACILVSAGIVIYKKNLSKRLEIQPIFFLLLFIVTSALPYVFISGSAFLDSRYLYFATAAACPLVMYLFWEICPLFSQKNIKSVNLLFFSVCIILFCYNYYTIAILLARDVDFAQVRKYILLQITNRHPKLTEKMVFFTKSDTSYYGEPDEVKILPFQSGLGQTLMVYYYFKGQKLPVCFFQDNYLYQITEEGFRYCQGKGFGYYWNRHDLEAALNQKKFSVSDVHTAIWEGKKKTLSWK